MKFQVLGIKSVISSERDINKIANEFLSSIEERIKIPIEQITSPDQFSSDAIPLIYVQTGGSENLFQELLPSLPRPITLLTNGIMNSLAASIEILTYSQQNNIKSEIIHGEIEYIAKRLSELQKIHQTKQTLAKARLGVIGMPSDWLIASNVDKQKAKQKFGCDILDIDINELITLSQQEYKIDSTLIAELKKRPFAEEELKKALNIYGAMKALIEKYQLTGVTLRCFDLLDTLHSTGCIALALLNSEGIPASCEGDVPSLITMVILNLLFGEAGFMVNPSSLKIENNSMIVAHCTLPINMTNSYSLTTHFESGIGVAVKGQLPEQKAMIFKVSPNLDDYFVSEIDITSNLCETNLCRTQIEIVLKEDVRYFITKPCGNHHIISLHNNPTLITNLMNNFS